MILNQLQLQHNLNTKFSIGFYSKILGLDVTATVTYACPKRIYKVFKEIASVNWKKKS